MSFSRITTAGDSSSASATTLVTSSFASVAGRLIVGYVGWEGGNTTISSVSDTAGNTYVVGTPAPHGTFPDQCIASFYCLSSLGNASNVITATLGASRNYRVIQAAEYSSAAAATLDGSAYGESLSAATTTTSAIATTGSVGLLFAGAKSYNSTTFTAGGSFSLIAQQGTFGADEDQLLTASGSYTATINHGITSVSLIALAFKEGASGPTVSTITGTTATEGSAVVFTVTMSGTGGLTDAYSWSGTAGAADYTQTLTDGMFTTTGGSGSVTVSGGNIVVPSAVTEFTVTVPTTGDTLDEANETIRLVFGGVTASSGTITDDDAPPTVSISDATESFGTVTHTLTLSQASGKTITVQVDSANGSKTAGTHYTAIVAQTVTFNPGETEQTVQVTVL